MLWELIWMLFTHNSNHQDHHSYIKKYLFGSVKHRRERCILAYFTDSVVDNLKVEKEHIFPLPFYSYAFKVVGES